MTKCDSCNAEAGPLLCGKCRAKLKHTHNLIPVLFYDRERKGYRAGCTVAECPWNENGVCVTVTLNLAFLKNILHEFDGDNIVKQACG
ncbi:Uncharacterised protein [uncultured archaeon]|nr:Uncharacterised protein [uncultured archaeon]